MPSRLAYLFACWRTRVALGVLLCGRRCLWRERNDSSVTYQKKKKKKRSDSSFEDGERMLAALESFFLSFLFYYL
jgi:hypothetical protein